MVIKLPFIATLKGHVQILNPLLDKGFIKIRGELLAYEFPARITHQDLESFEFF